MVKKKVQELWNKFTGKATQVSPGNTSSSFNDEPEGMDSNFWAIARNTPQNPNALAAMCGTIVNGNTKAKSLYARAMEVMNAPPAERDGLLENIPKRLRLRALVRRLACFADTFKSTHRNLIVAVSAGFLTILGKLIEGIGNLLGSEKIATKGSRLAAEATEYFFTEVVDNKDFRLAKIESTKWQDSVKAERQRKDEKGPDGL